MALVKFDCYALPVMLNCMYVTKTSIKQRILTDRIVDVLGRVILVQTTQNESDPVIIV